MHENDECCKAIKMKILIEKSDIKEVQLVAGEYYSLNLTTAQARKLIAGSVELQRELLYGELDTYARECLGDALIETLLKGKSKVVDKFLGTTEWHWPCNGSSLEYSKHFYAKFAKAAKLAGYELVEV